MGSFGRRFHVEVSNVSLPFIPVTTATTEIPAGADRSAIPSARLREVPAIIPLRVPHADEWTQTGEPLGDSELRDRVAAALRQFADLVPSAAGVDVGAINRDFRRIESALRRAYDAIAAITSGSETVIPPAAAKLIGLMTEIGALEVQVAHAKVRQRNDRYAAVRNALSRLHGVDSVEQMLERAPIELARCGFDRAFISRVEDATWFVEAVHVKGDAEWASEIARVGRDHPVHIDHLIVESEIMRRRAPGPRR